MQQYDIALIGGDARIAYMAPCFLEKGYRVICYGTLDVEKMRKKDIKENSSGSFENPITCAASLKEALEQSACVVGGISLFKDGRVFAQKEMPDLSEEEFFRCLKPDQMVFGGVIPVRFKELCRERNILCYDFMKDEPLAVFNAVATAEGAVLEALQNKETNIHGSRTLVLGYGRCGKVLAEKLKGLGAKVTVCSRCQVELACAEAFGFSVLPIGELEDEIHRFEYIYNTIPAVLLRKNLLTRMRRDVLIIDIASGEGGVDYVWAKRLGLQALHCLGLPGKYAPKISAKGLVDFVIRKMEQGKEICNGDKG